jgi:hypothetical protein
MFLFRHPTLVTPAYLAERATMRQWIVNRCGCGPGPAGQVLTDIENHNGTPGGGGITVLTATQYGVTYPVFHHSHGIIGTDDTCTIFWHRHPVLGVVGVGHGDALAKAVALGIHKTAVTYQIRIAPGYVFARPNAGLLPTTGATINPF